MFHDISYFAPALGAKKKPHHQKKSANVKFPYSKQQAESAINAMKGTRQNQRLSNKKYSL